VGKVIMAQYFQDLFASVWNASQQEAIAFHEAERKLVPANHAVIGAHLASRWQLPQGLTEAIRWHHDYQPSSQNADFSLIIYLSNIIVNSYNQDSDCVIDISALHPDARKLIMGALQNIGDFYTNIAEEIDSAYAFFLPAKS
jgi:HD-like signal output (HDOD) protein